MRDARPNWPNGIGLLLIHVGAVLVLLPQFFSWWAVLSAAIIAYATGALGVTLCYHRTLSHRSVRLRKPVEYATSLLGTLAFQGDPISWVATHRVHHAHADDSGDPHSTVRGFSWAHIEWLFKPNPNIPTTVEQYRKFCPDLWDDPFYRALHRLGVPIQVAFAALLFAIGGWPFVVWGIFGRLVFAYHSTWLVNSATHMFGYRTYRTTDRSTNSWWVALLSFGEGWHNNHHAFPYSARHGMAWYEIDITWWTIRLLRVLRLADKIRVPSAAIRERLRIQSLNLSR
ncbi:MAG TPA: fatty acid desaturase [Candidatus Baltobacteraceae bacterium]|nr:fatty acid desaturase [Candidatus Baltobacteraceae bacterium]